MKKSYPKKKVARKGFGYTFGGGFGGNGIHNNDPDFGIFRYDGKLKEKSLPASVEICFSFDTTGSMSGYIQEVKNQLSKITNHLLKDIPDIRISLIAHGDYCDANNYILKKLDFGNEWNELENFLNKINSTGGGDWEECYELVMKESQSLNWSPTSGKALVIIGDAPPHSKSSYRKIDWEEELNKLIALGIKVYGVQCGNATIKFYEEIANKSGASHLHLPEIEGIIELVMGLCYREAAEIHMEKRGEMIEKSEENIVKMPKTDKSGLSEKEQMEIHEAIHSVTNIEQIKIKGKNYKISRGYAGCKYVKIGESIYIEQNKEESSKYAEMAWEGQKITWVLCQGEWGLIKNGEILDHVTPEIEPKISRK